jgi:urease accessory protein
MKDDLLYSLLSWMSPAWPVGAFSHSSGLEWAVEDGLVVDRASCLDWLTDYARQGSGWTEAVLFTAAFRAVEARNQQALMEIVDLTLAFQGSYERRLESVAQGAAFRRIARSAAPCPALAMLGDIPEDEMAYPVAAACLMSGHEAPLCLALTAYLHGLVANLASAAQRLIPLGQTDSQRVIADLREIVSQTALRAAAVDPADLFGAMGTATLVADIACMAHETQYTRLFRT